MSGSDWSELERAWQSLQAGDTPSLNEELKRQRWWNLWTRAHKIGEVLVAIAGFVAGVWLISLGGTFHIIVGMATFLFVAAASTASIWAWSFPEARFDDPVMQSLANALRRVEVGLRLVRGTLWAMCAALIYLAVFAAAVSFYGGARYMVAGYIGIAIGLVWLSVVLVGMLIFQRYCENSRERLRAIEASLKSEV